MRLSVSLQCEFDDLMKNEYWKLITSLRSAEFYEIAKDRPTPLILDRSQDCSDKTEEELKENYLIYSFHPVENEAVQGSCEEFKKRKLISHNSIKTLSYQDVIKKYNRKLVIVGSQNLRNSYLMPKNIGLEVELSNSIMYCVLERIGRSRHYGELSSGPNSLNTILKDNQALHYLRSYLIKNRLICKQQLLFKANSKSSLNYLMHLPRFFKNYSDNSPDNLPRKIYNYLKSREDNLASLTDLMQFHHGTRKSLITFIKKHPIFVFDPKYSHKKIYPTDEKVKKDRFISVVYLRDPNYQFPVTPNDDDENEFKEEGLLDMSNQLFNVPLIHQVYQKIAESGSEGLSQQEIGNYFGLSKLTARSVMRRLKNKNELSFYTKDVGKQRFFKYIVKDAEIAAKQNVKNEIDRFLTNTSINTSNDDEKSPSKRSKKRKIEEIEEKVVEPELLTFEHVLENNLKVTATVQRVQCFPGYEGSALNINDDELKNKMSERILKRMNIIMEVVRNHHHVDLVQLVNSIREEESSLDVIICRKSIQKIASSIALAKQIQIFMIEMKSNVKNLNSFCFCDNSIKLNEEYWKPYIQQKIGIVFSFTSNEVLTPKIKTIIRNEKLTPENLKNFNFDSLNMAKFPKMQLFHEFMFHLIYEAQKQFQEIPIKKELNRWKIENTDISNHAEIEEEIVFCYQNELNWKTFVKPLKKRENCNEGWCVMNDITYRLPIIILVQMSTRNIEICKTSPEMIELISHPIKRNYPLYFLPEHLQKLFNTRILKNSCKINYEICKRLCLIGLLKFGPQRGKEIKNTFMFLNRNASLYDTTTSDPGYIAVSDKTYEKITFKFNSSHDVKDYWMKLQEISTSTPLNFRSISDGENEVEHEPSTSKLSLQCYLQPVEFDKVEEVDDGDIPGDRKGAGGLDSSFMSHIVRNWIVTKTKKVRKIIVKKAHERVKVIKRRFKRDMKLKREKIIGKKEMMKKKKILIDQVDRDILRRNKDLRAKWTESEDKTLFLTKVALKFMFRDENILTHNTIIRDILHYKSEKSIAKTSGSCLRRISNLMKKPSAKQKVALNLEELANNSETFLKYQNISERINQKYPPEKSSEMLKIAIVEFVNLLHKMYSDVSNSSLINNERLLQLPNQYCDIMQNFYIKRPKYQTFDGFSEVNSLENIEISTLQSSIMSLIHSFREKSISGRQALEIFQNLPENNVKTAIGNLRKSQLIAISKKERDKILTNPITSFYLSARYQHIMTLNIPVSTFNEIHQGILRLTQKPQKVKINFNSCGLVLLLAEMSSSKILKFSFEKAERLVTVDPNLKKNSNFEEISENYIQAQAIKKKGMRHVKLLTGEANDESFIFNEDPIEWFLKIDTKFLHIFCVLVNMKEFEDVSIKNFKLLETGWCSQNTCIFQDEMNFETILKEIAESFQIVVLQILESEIDSTNNDSVITKSNFIKYFDKFMEQSTENMPKKDIYKKTLMKNVTKVNTRRVLSKILDLGNSDLSEDSWISDYKKKSKRQDDAICDDEEENTSENFVHSKMCNQLKDLNLSSARVHDSFVVNFSTISAEIKENFTFPIYDKSYEEIENTILESSIWKIDDFKPSQHKYKDKNSESILKFIKSKKHLGATVDEILEKFSSKNHEIFDQLLSRKEILRAGVKDVRFVHNSNAKSWMITSYREKSDEPQAKKAKISTESASIMKERETIFIQPTPWIKIDGTLSREILNNWLGTLLIYINSHPGILLVDLAEKFNIIKIFELRNLCEILEQIGCVEMKFFDDLGIDIFSQYAGQNFGELKFVEIIEFFSIYLFCQQNHSQISHHVRKYSSMSEKME